MSGPTPLTGAEASAWEPAWGCGIDSGGSDYRCKFGDAVYTVYASYTGSNEVSCYSPSHAAGSVSVLVSLNGQQYTDDDVPFVYHTQSSVTSVSPTAGLHGGSTALTLGGADFQNSFRQLPQASTTNELYLRLTMEGR